jgi:hypothetical protein
MVVKVSKPEINVREKISALDKPSGTAGQAMLAAETPQEQFNLISAGRRNILINGAMQVAQRGTSVTGQVGSAVLTVDRFRGHGSGATFNMSQQEVTLGGESGLPIQFTKFLRFNATTGANNCGVWQAVEDVTRVQGTHTLSFYAKGTNPAGGVISLDIRQYFGSGGSSELDDDTRTFSVTSTWQKFTFTTTPSTVAGKTIGTSSYYRPFFKQPASDNGTAAWTLDITGVQLEVGKVATPFEHRSYGEELALCQRYYQKFHDPGSPTAQIMLIGLSSTYTQFNWWPPVEMRVRPTVGVTDTSPYWESHPWYAVGTSLTITQVSNAHVSRYGGEISVAGNWNPAPVRGTNYNISGEVFYWDAEL